MINPGAPSGAYLKSGSDPDWVDRPYRVMLVLGRPGSIHTSLLHAVEREFPWVLVEQRDDVGALYGLFEHAISLVLIDPQLLETAERSAGEILEKHPEALMALIEHGDRRPMRSFADIARSPLIRGVLPMNLRLDIWLSVVRLMLNGGEYFPPHMLRSQAAGARREPANGGDDRSGQVHMEGLTAREVQILEMVSRGLQNKSIATAFSLSEHTVKVHLHNIIAKLGVHNRTEAASRFRDRSVRRSVEGPPPGPADIHPRGAAIRGHDSVRANDP